MTDTAVQSSGQTGLFRTVENRDVFVRAYRDVFTAFLKRPVWLLLLHVLVLLPGQGWADVVKPALVEISVYTNGTYSIEVRASVEALLTGINSQYKNTTEAPTANEYDALRVLPGPQLEEAFKSFHERFENSIKLYFDGRPTDLKITRVAIPEPGYTKVPRNSVIYLEGRIPRHASQLSWYYPAAFGDNAVRVRQVDLEQEQFHWSQWQWIRSDKPSEAFSLTEVFTERTITSVIQEYVLAGYDHIVPSGMDHILFILGIFLLSTQLRPLFWQITMFTIAHSITLGLSMTGYISLPANIVEPLIALSIAYIGLENLWHKQLHRSRLVIVFAFGLLHGLGFASMLQEFGMPDDAFLTALISFNIGVELGQIAVLLAAFFAVGIWFQRRPWYRLLVTLPGSMLIGLTGLYWTYDRIMV